MDGRGGDLLRRVNGGLVLGRSFTGTGVVGSKERDQQK